LLPYPIALRQLGNASPGGIAQQIFAQPPPVSEKRRGRIRIDEDAGHQLCRVPDADEETRNRSLAHFLLDTPTAAPAPGRAMQNIASPGCGLVISVSESCSFEESDLTLIGNTGLHS
jgi:hypothetical protein